MNHIARRTFIERSLGVTAGTTLGFGALAARAAEKKSGGDHPSADGKTRNTHKWEDLRPEEFFREQERVPVVYWACGPMEDHGLQNALGVDPEKAYEICLRAAKETGGIVFPLVPFAPAGAPPLSREEIKSGKHQLFPPSLFVSVELCRGIYMELFESMAALGFRVCVAFGGHGPAATLLQKIAGELDGHLGKMAIITCGSLTYVKDLVKREAHGDPNPTAHGGKWETSMNMALGPERVDLSRVQHIDASPIPSQSKGRAPAHLKAIEASTAAFGEELMNTAARRLAAEVRKALGKGNG